MESNRPLFIWIIVVEVLFFIMAIMVLSTYDAATDPEPFSMYILLFGLCMGATPIALWVLRWFWRLGGELFPIALENEDPAKLQAHINEVQLQAVMTLGRPLTDQEISEYLAKRRLDARLGLGALGALGLLQHFR